MKTIVEFEQVCAAYRDVDVLEDVNLHIHPGQFIAIVGPSGSGKTSLMRAMLGTLAPRAGQVRIGGMPVVPGRPPRGVGYIPQLETIDWTFPVTVEEVVLMGCSLHRPHWPWASAADREQMVRVLHRLGIADLSQRHIRELSGGQQQRVFLARALVSDPALLLLDEPTSGVDIKTRDDVMHLLTDLNADGTTILMTCHELNAVAAHLPWVICFNRKVVAQGPPEEVFTSEMLSLTYGAEILVRRIDGVTLVGDVPHAPHEEARRHARAEIEKKASHAHH